MKDTFIIVSLKLIFTSPNNKRKTHAFTAEIRFFSMLNFPKIVHIRDYKPENDGVYVIDVIVTYNSPKLLESNVYSNCDARSKENYI